MTVTVTPTVEAGNWPPRVKLSITANQGEGSATITRTGSDGYTVPVRTADGTPQVFSAGSGLLYDYEMVYGDPVRYSSMASPATVSAQVSVSASQVWLVHPGVPALSMPARLASGTFTKRTAAARASVVYPMGRTNPLVVNDGSRKGYQSSLSVLLRSSTDVAALEALVADAGVLLLNVPTTLGYNFAANYIAVADVDVAPVVDKVFENMMVATLPFYVVDRPAGGTQAQRTLTDLTVYPTLAAINAAYPTLAAVLAGP